MRGSTLLRFALLAGLTTNLGAGLAVTAEPDANVARWVEQVLLGPEFGGQGKICSRWATTPTVSVHGATAHQARVAAETVAHLNETLADTSIEGLRLVEPNAPADILVRFAPIREFPDLARGYGFNYVKGNLGYFWTFWDSRHEIYRAYVLLAADRLRGAQLRHYALEELTQALGLSNDSPIFPDSIFYAGPKGGGTAEQLSDLDKRLLVFFYNHIRPGTRAEELRAAIEKYGLAPVSR